MENDRKTQIIKAAVKRFSKHGLGKTTLDEIARDLRIGKATIYHYFLSKEELFYNSVEFECDRYIEEIKSIFDKKESSLREKLSSYFTSKEIIEQKYKLLYDLFLLLMKENTLEKEQDILKSMLSKEEKILEIELNSALRKKEIKTIPSLSLIFMVTSWGWPFGLKLNQTADSENRLLPGELLNTLIDNFLID